MKKFITSIPPQTDIIGTAKNCYTAVDNQKLQYDKPCSFPIIPVINAYAEKGEEIEIIPILYDYDKNSLMNYEEFKREIALVCEHKNITCRYNESVKVPYNNELDTELDLFGKLIDCTADNDTLYCCVTFGNKPTALIQMMALNFAHRARANVRIGCIVYGLMYFGGSKKGQKELYDITSYLYIDETGRLLAEQGVKDPVSVIKGLLD